jgi:hypothetical protein
MIRPLQAARSLQLKPNSSGTERRMLLAMRQGAASPCRVPLELDITQLSQQLEAHSTIRSGDTPLHELGKGETSARSCWC